MKIDTTRPRLKLPAGLPKELIWTVFSLVVEAGWQTDQIRLACGVIDQMDADKPKRGKRGRGKHLATEEHLAKEAKALQFMLAHCHRTGETSARTLAKEALRRGYGGKGFDTRADIQRLAAALRRSLWFQGMKKK